jgi:transposase
MMTTTTTGTLYIALELSQDKWLLACATQAAQKPRFRGLPARHLARLQEEIAKAKARFGLPADAPVCTCYEAGRDGFWLHRALTRLGITNVVVDSGAIEVNRRRKHIYKDKGVLPDRDLYHFRYLAAYMVSNDQAQQRRVRRHCHCLSSSSFFLAVASSRFAPLL